MSLQALRFSALIDVKVNIEIINVDNTGITVSADGLTHVFLHGSKMYDTKMLKGKTRVILKQMVKQVSSCRFLVLSSLPL